MFPIRDDQPSFSTPFVNYFIIALNVVVFLFEESIQYQDPRAYLALMFQFGVVPSHISHALAGTGHVGLAGAFLPGLMTVSMEQGRGLVTRARVAATELSCWHGSRKGT